MGEERGITPFEVILLGIGLEDVDQFSLALLLTSLEEPNAGLERTGVRFELALFDEGNVLHEGRTGDDEVGGIPERQERLVGVPVDVHLRVVVFAQQNLDGVESFSVFGLQHDLDAALVPLDHLADLGLHLENEVRVPSGQFDTHRREVGFDLVLLADQGSEAFDAVARVVAEDLLVA